MTACAMQNNFECLEQLINVLLQPCSKFSPKEDELVQILHFKSKDGKTALNLAIQNNERFIVMGLLKLERKIHVRKKEGLQCLVDNHMDKDSIPQWILECYDELYEQSKTERRSKAFYKVLTGLIICSQLPYIFDVHSTYLWLSATIPCLREMELSI